MFVTIIVFYVIIITATNCYYDMFTTGIHIYLSVGRRTETEREGQATARPFVSEYLPLRHLTSKMTPKMLPRCLLQYMDIGPALDMGAFRVQ